MPDTPTPGQICYEAYQQAYDCVIWTLPWGQLQAHFRAVWEAAAQAVLQWQAAPRLTLDLDPTHIRADSCATLSRPVQLPA